MLRSYKMKNRKVKCFSAYAIHFLSFLSSMSSLLEIVLSTEKYALCKTTWVIICSYATSQHCVFCFCFCFCFVFLSILLGDTKTNVFQCIFSLEAHVYSSISKPSIQQGLPICPIYCKRRVSFKPTSFQLDSVFTIAKSLSAHCRLFIPQACCVSWKNII